MNPPNHTATDAPPVTRTPLAAELALYGLTPPGKVRKRNQDHFLIASLRKRIDVRQTSLPDLARLPVGEERIAFLVMVADGVGGGVGGEEARRYAMETATHKVNERM